MSRGSWFGAHRKQVITHLLIIAAFVLLTVFVFEPLIGGLEKVAGEAQLQELQLPAETDNIIYKIGRIWVDSSHTTVEITGWAFIDDYDSLNSEIYIVLKSTDITYVFTTKTVITEGVTQQFEELGLDLDYSGFMVLIPARNIADSEYAVGIYVRKGDVEALEYTTIVITKAGDTIHQHDVV